MSYFKNSFYQHSISQAHSNVTFRFNNTREGGEGRLFVTCKIFPRQGKSKWQRRTIDLSFKNASAEKS